MSRKVSVSIDNNFKGGLNTEATGLNFPENACTETYNCVHDNKGRAGRRPGFDFESGYTTNSLDRTDAVIAGYTWNNVAGDGSLSLRVVQVGSTLYFYDIAQTGALSDKLVATTVNLNTYAASGSIDPALNECQFSSGAGYLLVTHPQCEPFYVSYNAETEVATATAISPLIRDFEGVDDGLAVDDRPTATVGTMTATHKYNLYNQGWYWNSAAALTAWDTARADLPSNADVWWLFKNSSDAFDATTVANVFSGNAAAPKGHYLLNVFDQNRATASGIGGVSSTDSGTARFSAVAFMQGRAFYSGCNATGYSSKIYYTQIIENPEQFSQCYQVNDPTSEDLNQLLPTDGGVINIFGIESVIKMVPLVNVLLVFATNGIWAISGSQGIGFAATDYTVTKISSINAVYAGSFVDVNGFPLWWNLEGIYQLLPAEQNTLQYEVTSMTDDTIRSFFLDIPVRSRSKARGVYNPLEKKVHWIYRSEASSSLEEDYEYDALLEFNILTGGFYPWTISTGNVYVHDLFVIKGEGGTQSFDTVTDEEGFEIQDETGDVVTTFSISRFLIAPEFKYFVSYGAAEAASFTYAEVTNPLYVDWYSYDSIGQDYESTFTVGYKIHSDTQRFFQSNYVFVFLEQEAGASCSMRGLWEFTTAASTKRWSSPQEIYNSSLTNRAVNFRRLKVRGKGRALQLKFTSTPGAPFTIIGWSLWETQNASI